MGLHVVAVGRIRDPGIRAACDEYLRRIARTLNVSVREVRGAGRRTGPPHETRRAEAAVLRRAIPDRAVTVALTRTGQRLASDAFARRVATWRDGAQDVVFLLGGAFGLDAALLRDADLRLSLSPMTLPHELARLVLLEQLYRAGTILDGHPYHKQGPA